MSATSGLRRSAAVGFVVWLGVAAYFVAADSFIGVLRAALALALLVIVPLGVSHACAVDRAGRESRLARMLVRLQPFAAAAGVASLALPFGLAAAALTLPWLAVTVLVAL